MGATVIDSLVVELGLDPKNFTENQKKLLDEFKKTQDRFKKGGKNVEDSAGGMVDALTTVRDSMLEFLAVFIGTKDIIGFGNQIRQQDVALGRMALTIDGNVKSLFAWGAASVAAGGTAEDAYTTFQNLTQAFQDFSITGQSGAIPFFRAMGVEITDANGKMRDMNAILLDMSKWAQHQDPARAAAIMRGAGVSEGMIPLLLQSPDKVRASLEAMKEFAPTPEDVKNASDLTKQYGLLEASVSKLGNTYLTKATPALLGFLQAMTGLTKDATHPRSTLRSLVDEGYLDPHSIFARLFLSPTRSSPTASTSGNSRTAALLDEIGRSEGANYNSLYGKGRTFSDFSKFPQWSGATGPTGRPTHAAGRYQFEPDTWAMAAKALGLKDFSPESQDKAALWLAARTYRAATHRDLVADLGSGDPKVLAKIGAILSSQWTSLPHGSEQRTSSQAFASNVGARGAALSSTATNDNYTTSYDHSRELHIGQVNVNAPNANDANGISKNIGGALNNTLMSNADYGPH